MYKTNVAKVLAEALILLDEGRRWVKGSFRRKNKRGILSFCASGAVCEVGGPYVERARQALRAAVPPPDGQYVRPFVTTYNDHPRRTWPQIRNLFLHAIQNVEAGR